MKSQCDLCLEEYTSTGEYCPLKTFCCSHDICVNCIGQIIDNSSLCPWCKRKWIHRSALKECEKATPKNYFRELERLHKQKVEDDKKSRELEKHAAMHLGDGVLQD